MKKRRFFEIEQNTFIDVRKKNVPFRKPKMNGVERLTVVCKVLLDTRVLELRRENETLRIQLFWKDHGPESLKAAMRATNGAADGPGCG